MSVLCTVQYSTVQYSTVATVQYDMVRIQIKIRNQSISQLSNSWKWSSMLNILTQSTITSDVTNVDHVTLGIINNFCRSEISYCQPMWKFHKSLIKPLWYVIFYLLQSTLRHNVSQFRKQKILHYNNTM